MGAILALDVGERRIGIAASDALGILASPVETLERRKDADAVRAIQAHVEARRVEKIVVGLPKTLRNEVGAQAEKVLAFVEKLKGGVSVEIELWDERLTTSEAHRYLRAREEPGRRRKTTKKQQKYVKQNVDQVAAVLLLETYLESRRR
ncbi:MAG: Holliday junction resolvase RuvX [Candidatus Poribacteria bacterium]|nr:Holliday junction resolvase RuvX [Candidatus Poribacteria bacterium]